MRGKFVTVLILTASGMFFGCVPASEATDAKPKTEAAAAGLPKPTLADVPYGPHERQVLDFYKAVSDKPTPLLLFIHGALPTCGTRMCVLTWSRS